MKRFLFLFLCILGINLHAADYYWVGGGGNWSDLNHWRLGSTAGPVPSIVPSSTDNVFFTSGAGFGTTTATQTITLNSSGFCNNMTWNNVPNNPIFNTANTSFTVEVWGSMTLSPTTTYNCLFKCKGATPATITTNGTVEGAFGLDIDKAGSNLTVTDSLIVSSNSTVATNTITLTAGTFDIAGKKLAARMLVSNNSNVRTLNMSNSDLNLYYSFDCRGTNKTVNAGGSNLFSGRYLMVDNSTYNKVSNNGIDITHFFVYNCTFSSLTFINTSSVSSARIHDGNTADTIRFMGPGSIGSNNNANVIIAAGNFSIANGNTIDRVICDSYGAMGGDNNITYWQNGGQFAVIVADTNNVDSLLLTPRKIISFRGTFNVNNYLELSGTNCDAFSEVSGDSLSGSLNFAAGATAVMNNMILTGLKAYGPITPLAVSGIDNSGNAGFTITAPAASNGTRYWINGAGDWNDRSHWSTTSGGTGNACVPYIGDDVVFDTNSGFTPGNNTVTTSSSAFCRNMTWTAGAGTATFNESASYIFRIYGSLTMQPGATLNASLEFSGSNPASININGNTAGSLQFVIAKTGGAIVTLADNWNNPTLGTIVHRSGGLNLSGRTINAAFYTSIINSTRSVDISNATLNFSQYWDYRLSGKSLVSTGSHITTPIIVSDALSYPWVDVTGLAGTSVTSTTFGQLTFTDSSVTSSVSIGANNIIHILEFKGKGAIGTNNTIDTLLLAGSRNYTFAGTNTINKYLQAQSLPCTGLSEIKGNPTGTLAFSSSAATNMSNIYMQNMTATGPITPVTFSGADAGGNSGWAIISAAGGPRYWVGGAGNWNDAMHWSTSSGGAGGACIPTVYDNVYFDANSGFTASNTVTINNGNAYCHNLSWPEQLTIPHGVNLPHGPWNAGETV